MNVTMNAKNFLIHKTSFLLIVRPFNHIFYNRCKKYGVYFIGPNISTSIPHKQKVIHSCEWITLHNYSKLSSMAWIISDRKSTRLNSSHVAISYAVFCLKKKRKD